MLSFLLFFTNALNFSSISGGSQSRIATLNQWFALIFSNQVKILGYFLNGHFIRLNLCTLGTKARSHIENKSFNRYPLVLSSWASIFSKNKRDLSTACWISFKSSPFRKRL